jgi:hypothetical protein
MFSFAHLLFAGVLGALGGHLLTQVNHLINNWTTLKPEQLKGSPAALQPIVIHVTHDAGVAAETLIGQGVAAGKLPSLQQVGTALAPIGSEAVSAVKAEAKPAITAAVNAAVASAVQRIPDPAIAAAVQADVSQALGPILEKF